MLTRPPPAWVGWTIALLLLATTLGTWALCRAAALGDQVMLGLLQGPVEPRGTFATDDRALDPAPPFEQAEAYTAGEAGFQVESPGSHEEELLTRPV